MFRVNDWLWLLGLSQYPTHCCRPAQCLILLFTIYQKMGKKNFISNIKSGASYYDVCRVSRNHFTVAPPLTAPSSHGPKRPTRALTCVFGEPPYLLLCALSTCHLFAEVVISRW